MKILDENGNQLTGTPNLDRGKDYSIQIDFTDPIVDSYEVSFKNCKYKYGSQEIDLVSSGNFVSSLETLVKEQTSTSNRMATFKLVGFNVNDVKTA